VVFGTEILPPGYPFVPPPFTLSTSLFIHVGLVPLAGNMLFL
jgi:membrane associated rhomboid family serine protease